MCTLYLIPNLLSERPVYDPVFPLFLPEILETLDGVVAESLKGAGKLFHHLKIKRQVREIPHYILSDAMKPAEFKKIASDMKAGSRWGLISDAGYPAVADPGARLIEECHSRQIRVVPVPGYSSLILALAASGLNGQKFAFHGYLPRADQDRRAVLQGLSRESEARKMTQIFIETPYRNQPVLEECLRVLPEKTRLCVAADLTGSQELVISKLVSDWKKDPVELPGDLPALFLFLS